MRITLPDFLFERAFTFFGKFCIMKNGSCTTGCGSVWLECTAGGREVAGSNPVTPIFPLFTRVSGFDIVCRFYYFYYLFTHTYVF